MPKFKITDKKVKMGLTDIIKYQLITHCYNNRLSVTESDLECLTLLGVTGELDLSEFCILATQKKIFKSTQSVRNCIVKLERNNLLYKEGKSNKRIGLNKEIQVLTEGNILINYKVFHIESQEA